MGISLKRKIESPIMEPGYTNGFHNDNRETFVEVDGKIYSLIPTGQNLQTLINSWPKEKDQPKVRWLQPIPVRSKEEQKKHNEDADFVHNLGRPKGDENKITSTKKAILLGADIPSEVLRLMELKEKTKDEGELRRIRKQLRKLDYKRYINKEEK